MIVVSDASPLNYLILAQAVDVLPAIFEHVYVPECVVAELKHSATPLPVTTWMSAPPAWLFIRSPIRVQTDLKLDPGEIN